MSLGVSLKTARLRRHRLSSVGYVAPLRALPAGADS